MKSNTKSRHISETRNRNKNRGDRSLESYTKSKTQFNSKSKHQVESVDTYEVEHKNLTTSLIFFAVLLLKSELQIDQHLYMFNALR